MYVNFANFFIRTCIPQNETIEQFGQLSLVNHNKIEELELNIECLEEVNILIGRIVANNYGSFCNWILSHYFTEIA